MAQRSNRSVKAHRVETGATPKGEGERGDGANCGSERGRSKRKTMRQKAEDESGAAERGEKARPTDATALGIKKTKIAP